MGSIPGRRNAPGISRHPSHDGNGPQAFVSDAFLSGKILEGGKPVLQQPEVLDSGKKHAEAFANHGTGREKKRKLKMFIYIKKQEKGAKAANDRTKENPEKTESERSNRFDGYIDFAYAA